LKKDSFDFTARSLHDAPLHSISVDWESKTCTLLTSIFNDKDKSAVPFRLTWHNVTDIHIPHNELWGPSIFIYEQEIDEAGTYIIRMQSGDEIKIVAEKAVLAKES
jgi:hypothetical protein